MSAGRAIDAIVVGTSAGGIDALSVLLPALTAGFTGSVFVVLHLPRERPSLLVDIFAPKCTLAVRDAVDKEPVCPSTIYFAPPDYHLLIEAGPAVALSVDDPVNYSRPSIDVLFESAADIYGERLLGIILTGASQDSASGLAAIRRAGGVTAVQEPATAQVPVMVQAALDRGPVDFVRPLADLAAMLAGLGRGRLLLDAPH